MDFYRQQKGIILLYALLIISLVTAIAVTVSIIIINEIKLTTSATDGTLAYYAAESGLEHGLYTLKTIRMDPNKTITDALNAIVLLTANNFVNSASYNDDQSDSNAPSIENQLVEEDQYLQADYYNMDNPLTDSGVESIWLRNAGASDSGWAEVSWTAWNSSGELGSAPNARKVIGAYDLHSGWTINLDVFSSNLTNPITPVGYRVRVRALSGDISSLTVRPYDTQNGSPPPPEGSSIGSQVTTGLPSDIVIQSIGTRGQFKQALTASLPWKLPLFGLYDYVLFSEGDILKATIINRPIYSSGTIQVDASLVASCGSCALCTNPPWAATACTNASCTIQASPAPSYCTLTTTNNTFTLPIPASIPAGDEYYISIRTKANTLGSMEARISDPDQGDTGLTFSYPASGTDWSSCTIPESFALGGSANRSVRFTNQIAVPVNLDWYQISTYKIFPDCN